MAESLGELEILLEETTVKFPRDLTLEETEDLFKYIAQELPADVTLNTQYFRNFRHDRFDNSVDVKIGEVYVDDGSVSINANISRIKEPYAFDSCRTMHSDEDTSRIKGFEFSRIVDSTLEEYSKDTRQLWQDVRGIVGRYFNDKSEIY